MPNEEYHHGPTVAASASEDILAGSHLLRRAFQQAPSFSANRDAVVVRADASDAPCLLINRGVAYGAFVFPDGRRSISDILLPTDIIGLDHAVLGRPCREIIAASALGYRALKGSAIRELMQDHRVALRVLALASETKLRQERHIAALTRLDARGRIAGMILGIYERLRRQELISRSTFNLPLTQDQIADHLGITMVHVSRTLRRLREERVVIVDRHVVIIVDLDELRRAAAGLCEVPASPVFQREPTGQAAAAGT